MRRIVTAAISLLLPAAGLVVAAPAAHAADFDLYALNSPGWKVNTGSCRDVPVTARTTAPAWVDDIDATVDVWKGDSYIGNVWLEEVAGDPTRMVGEYFFCPGLEDPGVYRLGSTEVTWWDVDYNSGSFVDDTRGKMVVKQATRTKSFTGTRSGRTVTLHAHAQYFGFGLLGDSSWYNLPKGIAVTLQRRAANGTGSWAKVVTARVARRGRVHYTVTAAKRFQYRVYHPGTKRSWPLIGQTLVK